MLFFSKTWKTVRTALTPGICITYRNICAAAQARLFFCVESHHRRCTALRAVVGYAAAHLNRWHVDRELLLRCLALYTLFNAVVNLVTRRGFYDKARLPRLCPGASSQRCRPISV